MSPKLNNEILTAIKKSINIINSKHDIELILKEYYFGIDFLTLKFESFDSAKTVDFGLKIDIPFSLDMKTEETVFSKKDSKFKIYNFKTKNVLEEDNFDLDLTSIHTILKSLDTSNVIKDFMIYYYMNEYLLTKYTEFASFLEYEVDKDINFFIFYDGDKIVFDFKPIGQIIGTIKGVGVNKIVFEPTVEFIIFDTSKKIKIDLNDTAKNVFEKYKQFYNELDRYNNSLEEFYKKMK